MSELALGLAPLIRTVRPPLIELAGDILARFPDIPARNVVAHSDVAPTRKMDPGELFDWRLLAEYGIGLWPDEADAVVLDPDAVAEMLLAFGYCVVDRFAAIKAFQRHFRPERVNGRIDFETVRRLAGLLALCEQSEVTQTRG